MLQKIDWALKGLNLLWPSDAMWCQTSWSTVVQVMVCNHQAPSHHMEQCWLVEKVESWPLGKEISEIWIKRLKVLNKMWLQIFSTGLNLLTRWGRVTHICIGNLTIIGPDNGLSPGGRQAIIWTNAGILSIGPLGTNFSEILAEIITFSFKKMYLKVSSVKWRPFCLGLNVLTLQVPVLCIYRTQTLTSLCLYLP